MENLVLRKAIPDDVYFLFKLRNDELVKKNSFNMEETDYAVHEKWFREKINDNRTRIFILVWNDKKCGQVRGDVEDKVIKVSYALTEKTRGHGLGEWMLQEFERQLYSLGTCEEIVADVKWDNIISQKVFLRLGYTEKRTIYGYEYRKDVRKKGKETHVKDDT